MTNQYLTRRDFIKLSASTMGSLILPPFSINQPGHNSIYPIGRGRVATSLINVYSQPSFKSQRTGKRYRDDLLTIFNQANSLDGPINNPIWYRIDSGFVHSGYIQRVDAKAPNNPMNSVPTSGQLCEITVPYAQSWRYTKTDGWQPLYRLYYETIHWVISIDEGPDKLPWYRIKDHLLDVDYDVPVIALRVIMPEEYSPIAPYVPEDEKRIYVSLGDQTLTALEAGKVVLNTKISSGLPNQDDMSPSTETPRGSFWVQNKMPSRHMGDGHLTDDVEAYELPGVPWTCLFHEDGIALHGTYWHNNFGRQMSHGCINLRTEDAKWLFRWSNPVYTSSDYYLRQQGTLIIIN